MPKLIISFLFAAALLISGCSKLNSSYQSKTAQNDNQALKPSIPLTVKMLDNITIPSTSEILSDKTDKERQRRGDRREIQLKVPATVYATAQFYRTEMIKKGWTIEDRTSKNSEDTDSILAFLRFNNEKEAVDVNISNAGIDEGSEVRIQIGENPEYSRKNSDAAREEKTNKIINEFPLPDCISQGNRITTTDSLTISGKCGENIESIVKFLKTEAPKGGWTLKNQSGSSNDSSIMIFAKADQKAIVTLIKETADETSASFKISR